MGERMRFGAALVALENAECVARHGWNGKGMFLFLVEEWTPDSGLPNGLGVTEGVELAPFVAMKTADGKVVPWLASQTDILATDWEILDG